MENMEVPTILIEQKRQVFFLGGSKDYRLSGERFRFIGIDEKVRLMKRVYLQSYQDFMVVSL